MTDKNSISETPVGDESSLVTPRKPAEPSGGEARHQPPTASSANGTPTVV